MIETIEAPGWGIFDIPVEKPSWADATDWAMWIAQDANGAWYWYSDEPCADVTHWVVRSDSSVQHRFEMQDVEPVSPKWDDYESNLNRPLWDEAPEWANWLAKDSSGYWVWFEEKPILMRENWWSPRSRTEICVSKENIISHDWRETLEMRPLPLAWLQSLADIDEEADDVQGELSWYQAPEWAGWLFQDLDGQWYWAENRPEFIEKVNGIGWKPIGRFEKTEFHTEPFIQAHLHENELYQRPFMPNWSKRITDSHEEADMIDDMVNHPAHYTKGEIECIEVLEQLAADGHDFRILNAMKYLWRYRHKGGDESIRKAIWYLSRYLTD